MLQDMGVQRNLKGGGETNIENYIPFFLESLDKMSQKIGKVKDHLAPPPLYALVAKLNL